MSRAGEDSGAAAAGGGREEAVSLTRPGGAALSLRAEAWTRARRMGLREPACAGPRGLGSCGSERGPPDSAGGRGAAEGRRGGKKGKGVEGQVF